MKAAAVEHELEGTFGWRRSEKIQGSKAAAEGASLQFGAGSFDGTRRDIDAENVEAALGQPNRIRPGTRANFERLPRRDTARSDEVDEQRIGSPMSQGGTPEA
jgi:hypothetical protein